MKKAKLNSKLKLNKAKVANLNSKEIKGKGASDYVVTKCYAYTATCILCA